MPKILIVDNSDDLLEFLSILLTMNKYEVETAGTKAEFFEKLPQFVPDLILLDVLLGRDNGRDICRHLKSKTPFRHIPIILFSADTKSLEGYEECQASDVIHKPFDIKTVIAKINMYL